jgi:hypothetical protein
VTPHSILIAVVGALLVNRATARFILRFGGAESAAACFFFLGGRCGVVVEFEVAFEFVAAGSGSSNRAAVASGFLCALCTSAVNASSCRSPFNS